MHPAHPGALSARTKRQTEVSRQRTIYRPEGIIPRGSSPMPGRQLGEALPLILKEPVFQLLLGDVELFQEHRHILSAGKGSLTGQHSSVPDECLIQYWWLSGWK